LREVWSAEARHLVEALVGRAAADSAEVVASGDDVEEQAGVLLVQPVRRRLIDVIGFG
jgi:hypothetical protein